MGDTKRNRSTASLRAHTSSSHYYLNSNCYRIKGLVNRRSAIKANHFNNCSRKRRLEDGGQEISFLAPRTGFASSFINLSSTLRRNGLAVSEFAFSSPVAIRNFSHNSQLSFKSPLFQLSRAEQHLISVSNFRRAFFLARKSLKKWHTFYNIINMFARGKL